jgi:FkbM family methyltransferase
LSSEHFNPAVDDEFFKLAQSAPGSPGLFSSNCPEHQWEGRYRLRPGDTFVEAGAFWGRYGLIASKRVGPEGKVVLIEGNPQNIDMIERVIKHYSLSNVTLVKGIVWSRDEYTKMCVWGNPAGSRRALDSDLVNYPDSIVDVRAYTLDALLPELGVQNVDLLACDVEGAEVEMVLGADRYLGEGRIRNVALAAYHQAGFPERIMGFLRERGFVDLFYSYDLPQFGGIVYGRSQK